jgi:hypothetical protein
MPMKTTLDPCRPQRFLSAALGIRPMPVTRVLALGPNSNRLSTQRPRQVLAGPAEQASGQPPTNLERICVGAAKDGAAEHQTHIPRLSVGKQATNSSIVLSIRVATARRQHIHHIIHETVPSKTCLCTSHIGASSLSPAPSLPLIRRPLVDLARSPPPGSLPLRYSRSTSSLLRFHPFLDGS